MRSDCEAAATLVGFFEWMPDSAAAPSYQGPPAEMHTTLSLCRAHADAEDQLGALRRHFMFVARAVCIATKKVLPGEHRLVWRPIQ
jgi:hypothetical protein